MEQLNAKAGLDLNTIQSILRRNRDRFSAFGVQDIYLFGSIARGEPSEKSDVDILVDFTPEARIGLFEFVRFRDLLGDLLNGRVDLVTRDGVHVAIHNFLYSEETGLPMEQYTEDEVGTLSDVVYQHIFAAYSAGPSPAFATA